MTTITTFFSTIDEGKVASLDRKYVGKVCGLTEKCAFDGQGIEQGIHMSYMAQ